MSLSEPGSPVAFGLWHYVWKLLRLRVVLFISSLRRARLRRKIGMAVIGLLLLALIVFLFWLSTLLLGFVQSPQLRELIDPAEFLAVIPTLAVTLAFFFVSLTNFGALLQTLYLAKDMDFLLVAPVPQRAVFLAKLLQGVLPNFGLFCLFALPLLFGLGASSGYSFLYYPMVIIELAGIALAASGLTGLLVMGVVRVVPARRVAEVLGFLGAIISILLGQSGQFTRFMNVNQNQVSGLMGGLVKLNSPLSPLSWAGRSLIEIGRFNWLPGLGLALLTLGVAGAIFMLALSLTERLYYSGWARMQGSEPRKKAQRRAPSAGGRIRILPAQVRGVIWKDWLVMRRDLRNLSQLITPLILGFILLITSSGPAGGGQANLPPFLEVGFKNVNVYFDILLALFVCWMLNFSLAMVSFSREGKNYWLLKAAPVSTGRLLLAKFIGAYLPTFLIGWAFLLPTFPLRQVNWAYLPYSTLVVALVTAGMTGVALSFGVAGARMDWEDPRQMNARGAVGCVGMIVGAAYFAVSLAIFFLPPVLMTFLQLGSEEAWPGDWAPPGQRGCPGLRCLPARRRVRASWPPRTG